MRRGLIIARREGIKVRWGKLPDTYNGLYCYWPDAAPCIVLSHALRRTTRAVRRSTLWEELGHHYTLLPYGLYGRWPSHAQSVHRSMLEARALRWAAEHILTDREWRAAERLSIESVDELSDFWEVTPELAEEIVRVRRKEAGQRVG